MNEREEASLRSRLEVEDEGRNRKNFNFTYDALPHLMTYTDSHTDVKKVISGEIDYENLPMDKENEAYKGFAFKDQAIIVKNNQNKQPLCEALEMQPCKQEGCPIYIAAGAKDSGGDVITKVPLCREFKMAFKK